VDLLKLFSKAYKSKRSEGEKSAKISYSMENVCGWEPLKKHSFMPVLCLRTGQSPKKGY
jgi:hypothetical protein